MSHAPTCPGASCKASPAAAPRRNRPPGTAVRAIVASAATATGVLVEPEAEKIEESNRMVVDSK